MAVNRKQLGFTLIELLLSLTIFTSLVALASYSIMHFDTYWNKKFGGFESARVRYQLLNQLNDVYLSAFPQTVLAKNGNEVYYFLGDEKGNTFVTSSPVFSGSGNNAVVRIFKEKVAQHYELFYEEAPLYNTSLVSLEQQLNFVYRVRILSAKNNINFKYCGYIQRFADLDNIAREKPKCFEAYDGVKTSLNPDIISIQFDQEVLAFRLSNAESLIEHDGFDL